MNRWSIPSTSEDKLLSNLLNNNNNSNNAVITTRSSFDSFSEMEASKVFDAMLSIQARRVQLGTFFGTATATGIGIAFTTNMAGLFFISALFLWLFIFLDIIDRGAYMSAYCRYLLLSSKFSQTVPFHLSVFIPARVRQEISRIKDIPDDEKQMQALHRLSVDFKPYSGFWIPLWLSFFEIAFGILLHTSYGWKTF